MAIRCTKLIVLCLLLLYCVGCTEGIIYTKITRPYTRDIHNDTPIADSSESDNQFEVREPLTGAGVNVQWAHNAIGDIAKKHGLTKVYYADIMYKSILAGIWSQEYIIVYGEKETPPYEPTYIEVELP